MKNVKSIFHWLRLERAVWHNKHVYSQNVAERIGSCRHCWPMDCSCKW